MPVAHVQTTKTVNNAGTSPQVSGAMTTSAGGLLLFGIMAFNTGTAVPVPTSVKLDNTTAMGTGDVTLTANTSSNFNLRSSIYSLPNVAAGSHSVTVVWPAGIPTNCLYFFTEVSGAATSSQVDGVGHGGSGVGTAASSGTFTTTNATDFWYAITSSLAANPATFSAGASFTIPTNGSETNSAGNLCGACEFWANPGATSGAGTFTLKTGDWVAVAIGYNAAAGGGGFVGSPLMAFQAGWGNL